MADSAKNKILAKIKQALAEPVPEPFTLPKTDIATFFYPSIKDLEIEFAENFSQLSGKFSYCDNDKELAEQLNNLVKTRNWNKIYCREPELKYLLSLNQFKDFEYPDLNTCQASITSCEFLVAQTGSIFLSSLQKSGRGTSVYAPVHICIAYTNQLVYSIGDGLTKIQEKYHNQLPSLISLASGPSRTADIEKTLVTGIHGPKEVFVFLLDK